MKITSGIMRALFVAYFALNGWNKYADSKNTSVALVKSYGVFEKTVTARTGVALPDILGSKTFAVYAPVITNVLSVAQIALSALALFGSSLSLGLLGTIYFIQELVHLNVAKLSLTTTAVEAEQFALSVALFVATWIFACHCSSTSACDMKARSSAYSDIESDRSRSSKTKRD